MIQNYKSHVVNNWHSFKHSNKRFILFRPEYPVVIITNENSTLNSLFSDFTNYFFPPLNTGYKWVTNIIEVLKMRYFVCLKYNIKATIPLYGNLNPPCFYYIPFASGQ